MLDTMTFTKVVGGLCGALLIYLMGKWAAETLYHSGGGGHGDDHAAAYIIETGGESDEPEVEVDFSEVLAAADLGKGERVFGKCKACHKLDGTNATGPYLNGIVNRAVGAVDGFGYSGALNQVGDAWTVENLNAFLESPKGTASGTTMSFNGLSKIEDRANVIAYLEANN